MSKTSQTGIIHDSEVYLRPYSRAWKWRFRLERLFLRIVLGRSVGPIEHIGSTAIPGMIAKPIIDIQVAIDNLKLDPATIGRIERIGYRYRGISSELRQHLFTKGSSNKFNLYLLESCNPLWINRSAVRDYLRAEPEGPDWRAYFELKQRLAAKHPGDVRSYQKGKVEFLDGVIERATRK